MSQSLRKKEQEQARRRASVIMKVRSGQISAREGAHQLGISRKTYYEWEQRALQAMIHAMESRSSGRPTIQVDAEKERLKDQVKDLGQKLLLAEKTIEVKDLLSAYDLHKECKGKKNRKVKKTG